MTDVATKAPQLLLYAMFDPERTDAGTLRDVFDMSGVQDQPIRSIPGKDLSVLASPVEDSSVISSPSMGEVLAFKRVVDTAFQGGPLIPLRFGTLVRSNGQAEIVLQEKGHLYADLLGRLDGQAEMGICLSLKSEGNGENDRIPSYRGDRPGTAYLLARQQSLVRERQRAEALVAPFREALGSLATSVSTSPRHDAEESVSIAFLVPRKNVDRFREIAGEVSVPAARSVEVVGPWAPYSFV
ncbi:hypothetical protein CRI94_06095 [Longibacter salinarum]|uniref:Uncharacterized protein n=1 Tax=Longibacter salinarum TaxID=1850348 RepID=A0A2A8D129_9BACT|nr:GvpL/GvpF family gas vesicle protein [Longibacter salinarum]PEN14590.1 hypothetical protein CRI94_06095 [Longibacter salinarum]